MRGALPKVLVFLGAFLLTVAALAAWWAPGKVEKTPLDTNSVTRLSGEATVSESGKEVRTPVKATSTTHADSAKSSDDVILFQNSSCLIRDPNGTAPDCVSTDDPDKRLLSAGTSQFATDRHTAVSVPGYSKLSADAEPKSGLINKFPFNAQKKSYPFWDDYVNKPLPANFQGSEKVDGLETYKYEYTVADAPFDLAPSVPGLYTTEKTMWVDPKTGSIINQQQHLVQKEANSGRTVINLDFGFTPETVKANVESAKANGSKLSLLTFTVPLVAGIVGLVSLLAGLTLAMRSRRGRTAHEDAGLDTLIDDAAARRRGLAS